MKFSRSKTAATAIALFLMLTITATLIALPTVNAHYPPWTVKVWCYVNVSPNLIGVNQQALLAFWINVIPPTTSTDSRFGDRWIFNVDVVKPDGTNDTLGPFTSDPVGGAYCTYTPTQVGTYTFVAHMPAYVLKGLPSATGAVINNAAVNDTYGPATSEPAYLTVQQEPIKPWPEAPLPTGYWTRPINSANRDWYVLAANWLSGAANTIYPNTPFAYGKGPESAHIMWTRPYYAGGIMDERFGNTGYETMHYQGISIGTAIIIQGKLIVANRNTAHTTSGWWVIDLYTGETLSFENTTTMPAFGQIYNYESPNQHGGFPYLWRTSGVTISNPGGINGTVWELLDGFTLQSITKIANVTSGGTAVYGKDGSILRYNLVNLGTTANPKRYLQVWNSSAIPSELLGTTGTNFWQWRPAGQAVHNGQNGFSLNVSIPDVQGSIRWVREDQDVIGGTTGSNDGTTIVKGNIWALSLKPGQEGTLLWNTTFTPPVALGNLTAGSRPGMMFETLSADDGVFIFRQDLTRQYWGYSMTNGEQLWASAPESQMQFYGLSTADDTAIYQGKFFSYGYGGQVTAYNITTGKVVWIYNATNVGFESPYGNYPVGIACACDGKLYLTTSEHSPTQPLFRGSYLRCINATDGTEIWKVLHWSAGMAAGVGVYIADGYLVSLNSYDNQLYCYGKGPSATTVTASPKSSAQGTSVVIEGMVTDQSPGAKKFQQYPEGTPAISDADQEAWMEYLYAQQAMPTNAKGVEVTLDAVDPNNNYIHIGTATSGTSGTYSYMFTPEVPGKYTIIATFAGSASYYSSYAETAIGISEAPAVPAAPEPAPAQPPLDMYILYATVAIIIAVAIVGLMLVRMLRKRP
jgi:hypothetical protein